MIDENIYELMKHSFGGAIHTIFIPSFGRSVPFKEPTIRETKLISKIVIANQKSQSIVYASTLALIKGLCVEKDFNQYKLTEFDRIAILANLFANNFLSKQLSLTCKSNGCNHQFIYTVKHGDLIKSIESLDVSDIVFESKNDNGDIQITLNYPNTRQYLEFLESMETDCEKNEIEALRNENGKSDKYSELNSVFSEIETMQQSSSETDKKVDIQDVKIAEMIAKKKQNAKSSKKSIVGNIDISGIKEKYSILDTVDLYIKDIKYHIAGDSNEYHIVFDDSISFDDRERILGMFPMSFLTLEDGTSILELATIELDKRLKTCVPTIECPKCKTLLSGGMSVYDFFIHG